MQIKEKNHRHKLSLFWESKSKDTTFIDDLKHHAFLEDLIRYDTNFNNKWKVAFESALAGIIRLSPGKIKNIVNHVAQSIWPDIENAFLKSKYQKSWICQHMMDVFYHDDDTQTLYLSDIKHKKKPCFYSWMRQIIYSTQDEDVYKQLLLIRHYGYFFLRPFEHIPKSKNPDPQNLNFVPKRIGDIKNKIKMRQLWEKYRKDNWPSSESLERSRVLKPAEKIKKNDSFGIFDNDAKIKPAVKKFLPHMHMHLPGMNVWRVVHTSLFTQEARYHLDMPLISSQSDSISLLLIPAMVVGKLSGEHLRSYALAAISYMVGNGHHAIHEFKPVLQAFGIPYTDGDYTSLFSRELIRNHPGLKELQHEFPDLLPSDITSKI